MIFTASRGLKIFTQTSIREYFRLLLSYDNLGTPEYHGFAQLEDATFLGLGYYFMIIII